MQHLGLVHLMLWYNLVDVLLDAWLQLRQPFNRAQLQKMMDYICCELKY